MSRISPAGRILLLGGCLLAQCVLDAHAHTWMFSKGRAWMQASLEKPFRARVMAAGQGTHAQLGPNQTMVVRWASSHNNTFSLAVIAGKDEAWFHHKDFYTFLHDYIDSAPAGTNEAVEKPRCVITSFLRSTYVRFVRMAGGWIQHAIGPHHLR
jgi:hypothetical protein